MTREPAKYASGADLCHQYLDKKPPTVINPSLGWLVVVIYICDTRAWSLLFMNEQISFGQVGLDGR